MQSSIESHPATPERESNNFITLNLHQRYTKRLKKSEHTATQSNWIKQLPQPPQQRYLLGFSRGSINGRNRRHHWTKLKRKPRINGQHRINWMSMATSRKNNSWSWLNKPNRNSTSTTNCRTDTSRSWQNTRAKKQSINTTTHHWSISDNSVRNANKYTQSRINWTKRQGY